jgi:NADH-quinone oxidoreductase subunit J
VTDYSFGSLALFYFLAFTIVAFSVLMLFSRNFVHSAAYLAMALLSFSGVYALLNATFLALLQLFIYAGSITVVVVFVIMMTRVGVSRWDQLLQKQSWLAVMVVGAFSFGLLGALRSITPYLGPLRSLGGTEAVADALLTTYAAPFEISSLILLASLVGAIYLAREGTES